MNYTEIILNKEINCKKYTNSKKKWDKELKIELD